MRRVRPKQPKLPSPGQLPEESKAANERAIEEGVRLARFVPLAECRACSFVREDHTYTRGGVCQSNICLKDLYSKEVENKAC